MLMEEFLKWFCGDGHQDAHPNAEILVGMSEEGGDEPGYVDTFQVKRAVIHDGKIILEVVLGEPFFIAF